ncbi:MAG TPA: hypothetical protein VFM75_02030 [Modicisalibacter sp.]|nr:hypothetical protein [Modicisalibacter sp.]
MTIEYLTNRDAVIDILEADKTQPLAQAMLWAHDKAVPELTDLWRALHDNAQRGGNCMAGSNEVYRATAILLDAWISDGKMEVAA